ncbi:MAG: flagellar basal body rod protein FlgB [Pseudomonadota bacterium]
MTAFDSVLGVSPQVLAIRSQRTELLAANIANATTPGYKARDIDFRSAMQSAMGERAGLSMTHELHLPGPTAAGSPEQPLYRMPSQPSPDGNTVESQREHAEFMDNAVRYQASLTLLDARIRGLRTAIRGQLT